MIKRISLIWAFFICPNWWPNRSSFVKLEALFENKLSKKALKNVFFVILTLSKSPAQSEAQTRETDDSDPNNPITRNVGSDPIFSRIRIPNSGNRSNRVKFSLGQKPTRPVDSPCTKRHCSYSFFLFFFQSSVCIFFSFYIYYYTDTTNFIIFSQLLRYQFLIIQNKITKYETVTNHNWK